MNLIQTTITPAEGEQSVRTYCCTRYNSKLLGLKTDGYLGVTNKRVIYQAVGSTAGGRNVIQSEVPIADISGITSFKGIYFSIIQFLLAGLLTYIVTALASVLIGGAAVLLESYTAFQILTWVIVVGGLAGSFLVNVKSIWRSVLASLSAAGLVALGGGSLLSNFSLFGGFGRSIGWQFFLAVLVNIYALLCSYWYARRPTFSLEINSKGGASTPISIASASGLFNLSVRKILKPAPAKDAEVMLKELGALILDIQMLGDYGIEKWKVQ